MTGMRRLLILAGLLVLAVGWLWRRSPTIPGTMLPYPAPPAAEIWRTWSPDQRLADLRARVQPGLNETLAARGTPLGSPTLLRAFKETGELELWLAGDAGWQSFRTYAVAAHSGGLGPKQREGDRQVPEGAYGVTAGALNPASTYHLSFNIGYPNAEDRRQGRTGSFIMIHGGAVSIGCLAMTDPWIEEIYLIVEAALQAGQAEVPVHIFPFRMHEERLRAAADSPWHAFWQSLRPLHDEWPPHQWPSTSTPSR
jgi:murein L,D-transpeptidase YafK